MYIAKEATKRMKRMALMAQKKSKELSNEILVQKGGKPLKKRKAKKLRCTSSSSQCRFQPRGRKKRRKKQVKRSEGKDLLVRLRLHCFLIPRALRVRKKTKKSRGSMLYRMNISLNGPPIWACILRKHTVWKIHPSEKSSRRNLWSTSRTKQLEPSQENRQIFERSIEGEKQKYFLSYRWDSGENTKKSSLRDDSLIQSMVKVGEC